LADLYSNENFPRGVVEELRRLGHDVLTVFEAGNAGQRIPDDEVLRFAVSQLRAVVTINRRDFIARIPFMPASLFAPRMTTLLRFHSASMRNCSPVLAGQLLRVIRPQ
jgi:hypothetical protein